MNAVRYIGLGPDLRVMEASDMRQARRILSLTLALVSGWALVAAAQDKPIELRFSSWVATVHGHHTGVMVHLVPDEGVDNGPVLGQQEIYFQPDESPEQFERRVHEVEQKVLVNTLKHRLEETQRST